MAHDSIFYGLFVFLITTLISFNIIGLQSVFIGIFALVLYSYWELRKPHFEKIEKEKEIQANLVFAVRDVYTNLKTTGRMRDAISSVAFGGYGHLSEIFREILFELEAGKDDSLVFSKASKKSNLPHFQRFIAILNQSDVNLLNTLQQFILDLKRERLRILQAYELKSELHAHLIPLILIGAAAFLMVTSVMGFYFSTELPIFQVVLVNYIALPYIFMFILFDLKKNNPRI